MSTATHALVDAGESCAKCIHEEALHETTQGCAGYTEAGEPCDCDGFEPASGRRPALEGGLGEYASSPYCDGCFHLESQHRGSKCFEGAVRDYDGGGFEIACLCNGFEPAEPDPALEALDRLQRAYHVLHGSHVTDVGYCLEGECGPARQVIERARGKEA